MRGQVKKSTLVLNAHERDENLALLAPLSDREFVKVMIHEQYFYPDYERYQSDFEQKLSAVFSFLSEKGFRSAFFENCIE